ncbi:MAG: YicC/YloC family endoribonuclease [Bacteroidota bacterium]|nr:YicC/YloC family endoribonuclease [Bacteroidota bacterium]
MIQSMTGYGKAECEFQSKKITVEIKSLNSKQLDLNSRVPSLYKEKELDLRNEISRELTRGKVDLYISVDSVDEDMPVTLNSKLVKGYYQQVANISKELNLPLPDDIITSLLRLPDVLKSEKQEVSEEEWAALSSCASNAIKTLKEFRFQEGIALEKDITERIRLITDLAIEIEPFEEQRIIKVRQKIQQGLVDLMASDKLDQNRFEQELIYYIEKLDITEEKVRLANHCKYFMETINSPDSNGKKLAFITQEIGREINTIGSKSNDSDMQKIVVQMKDELEKIKEQINNVL